MSWFRRGPVAAGAPPGGRVRLLRESAERTRAALAGAGVDAAGLPAAYCRHCGLQEELLFWRFVSREGPVLRFDCPVCGRRHVRLDLRTRELRGSDPLPFGGTVGRRGGLWRRGSLYRLVDYLPVALLTVGAMFLVSSPGALLDWLERRGEAVEARARAPAADAPAAGGEHVFAARGDHRAEIARLREEEGARGAAAVLGVSYDPARDVTEVRLAPDATEWALRLRLRGWR